MEHKLAAKNFGGTCTCIIYIREKIMHHLTDIELLLRVLAAVVIIDRTQVISATYYIDV